MNKEIQIQIQAYWDAKIKSIKQVPSIHAEDLLNKGRKIVLCEITINDKFIGYVMWDGKEITIDKILSFTTHTTNNLDKNTKNGGEST